MLLLWQKKIVQMRYFLCLLHRNLLPKKCESRFWLVTAFVWSAAGQQCPPETTTARSETLL